MDIVFGGSGGGCGDPRCEACSGGRMGGIMPPFQFPGLGMPPPFMPCGPGCTGDCQNPGGGFPGPMPGGINFPGFPPPSGPGPSTFPGPYPQPTEWPGIGPGNFGGPSGGGGAGLSESPYVYPLGTSGQRINLLIDTGASLTLISTAAYNKHFRSIPVCADKRINLGGIGGGLSPSYQRFTMPLTFDFGNGKATVEGEAWICDSGFDVDCLLGLPYLRANQMSLEWGSNGEPDSVMVQGHKIPINVESKVVQYLVGNRSGRQRKGRLIRLGGKRK